MKQLARDIKQLQDNLTHWHAIYHKTHIARVKRLIRYLKELQQIKGEQK